MVSTPSAKILRSWISGRRMVSGNTACRPRVRCGCLLGGTSGGGSDRWVPEDAAEEARGKLGRDAVAEERRRHRLAFHLHHIPSCHANKIYEISVAMIRKEENNKNFGSSLMRVALTCRSGTFSRYPC